MPTTDDPIEYRTDRLPMAITQDELETLVANTYGDDQEMGEEALYQISDWISAGYGILVYSNHDMGHSMVGHRIYLKVGPGCTIEHVPFLGTSCPVQLPDGLMAWRYYIDCVHYNDQGDR